VNAETSAVFTGAQLQNSIRTKQEQLEAAETEHASLQQRLASATAGREDTVSAVDGRSRCSAVLHTA